MFRQDLRPFRTLVRGGPPCPRSLAKLFPGNMQRQVTLPKPSAWFSACLRTCPRCGCGKDATSLPGISGNAPSWPPPPLPQAVSKMAVSTTATRSLTVSPCCPADVLPARWSVQRFTSAVDKYRRHPITTRGRRYRAGDGDASDQRIPPAAAKESMAQEFYPEARPFGKLIDTYQYLSTSYILIETDGYVSIPINISIIDKLWYSALSIIYKLIV